MRLIICLVIMLAGCAPEPPPPQLSAIDEKVHRDLIRDLNAGPQRP